VIKVQIITRNNAKTIKKTLESLANLNCSIIIGDLGSTDDTLKICSSYGVEIKNIKLNEDYSKARNALIADGFNFYIEPWEVLATGHDRLNNLDKTTHLYCVNKNIVSKEIRFWTGCKFRNPVYETIVDKEAKYYSDIVLVSSNSPNDIEEKIRISKKWLQEKPTQSDPYYYLACSYLAKRMYNEFFTYANQYLIMENKKPNASSIMLFYYMAQIKLHTGMLQEAATNILTCLSLYPTMSEFWCLLGDIIYKQQKYEKAKSIYENALIIGKRRKQNDEYPIEISKYDKYPRLMIDSIKNIKEKIGIVIQK